MTWLTVADLAVILGLKKQTIYNRLSSSPETLPPATRVPKLRGPRWSLRIVQEWQARFDPSERSGVPRRPGRPTKAEEVARRLKKSAG
ncbi:helix-turn-helix domain-containing protein [Azospirillum thermophilum]|uniref:helix-turn-helix domain-containing protein n=1 Tax=Azospirillum thermophilum TaxID=2202148 RepID=UPI0011B43390|nr:helix-turn-helix domain-containing protein [Azospirillum thermophilum]